MRGVRHIISLSFFLCMFVFRLSTSWQAERALGDTLYIITRNTSALFCLFVCLWLWGLFVEGRIVCCLGAKTHAEWGCLLPWTPIRWGEEVTYPRVSPFSLLLSFYFSFLLSKLQTLKYKRTNLQSLSPPPRALLTHTSHHIHTDRYMPILKHLINTPSTYNSKTPHNGMAMACHCLKESP